MAHKVIVTVGELQGEDVDSYMNSPPRAAPAW